MKVNLIELHCFGNSLPTEIHKSIGLQQQTANAIAFRHCSIGFELMLSEFCAAFFCKGVKHHEACIMARVLIFVTDVAKSGDDIFRRTCDSRCIGFDLLEKVKNAHGICFLLLLNYFHYSISFLNLHILFPSYKNTQKTMKG